ncbi:hypothetical protein [Streptomyces phytophilus]|uniref:hypothetical protein n=1 Tax=Streptomyces phytophilus TaxID=722715 RepID=UPI0015F08CE8|nr:hypothetical protein [Streptomyces phytophilus]
MSLAKIPSTPTEVAAAVLEVVETNPDGLDMSAWFSSQGDAIQPGDDVSNTTMCVAGWAAHAAGWTLVYDDTEGRSYAEQDGVRLYVREAGRLALGLNRARAAVLFASDYPAGAALAVLRHIANPP